MARASCSSNATFGQNEFDSDARYTPKLQYPEGDKYLRRGSKELDSLWMERARWATVYEGARRDLLVRISQVERSHNRDFSIKEHQGSLWRRVGPARGDNTLKRAFDPLLAISKSILPKATRLLHQDS